MILLDYSLEIILGKVYVLKNKCALVYIPVLKKLIKWVIYKYVSKHSLSRRNLYLCLDGRNLIIVFWETTNLTLWNTNKLIMLVYKV